MRINQGALLSFIGSWSLLATSLCWADDGARFASFPDSCALQAQKSYDKVKQESATSPRQSGQDMGDFWDLKAPAATIVYHAFGFERRLLLPVGHLVWRGIANDIKPRISNKASREAKKFYFSSDPGWAFLYSKFLWDELSTETLDHYGCITDKCPEGATCETVDITKAGEELVASLPAMRKQVSKMFRWADSVKIFGRRVDKIRKAYDRDEAQLKHLIAGLPNELVIINLTLPVND